MRYLLALIFTLIGSNAFALNPVAVLSSPCGAVEATYVVNGNLVALTVPAIECLSLGVPIKLTGLPTPIRPAHAHYLASYDLVLSGFHHEAGAILVGTDGSIETWDNFGGTSMVPDGFDRTTILYTLD